MTNRLQTITEQKSGNKVLFFDIDGCLHPLGIAFENGDGNIYCDPPNLRFVWAGVLAALLVPHPDVKLVCHSTWRHNYALDALLALLPTAIAEKTIGITDSDLSRHESILAYAEDYGLGETDYLILDDDASAFESPVAQLVLVPSNTGISTEAAQSALAAALEELSRG